MLETTEPTSPAPRFSTGVAAAITIAATIAAVTGAATAVAIADRNAAAADERHAQGTALLIGDLAAQAATGSTGRLQADLAEACRAGIAWPCGIVGIERDPIIPETIIARSDGTLPAEQIPAGLTHSHVAARILDAAPAGTTRVIVVSPAGTLGSADAPATEAEGPQL